MAAETEFQSYAKAQMANPRDKHTVVRGYAQIFNGLVGLFALLPGVAILLGIGTLMVKYLYKMILIIWAW